MEAIVVALACWSFTYWYLDSSAGTSRISMNRLIWAISSGGALTRIDRICNTGVNCASEPTVTIRGGGGGGWG